MFDIGFFELLLIGVVALLVIGPEQLPETLRTLALWWGRLKRGLSSTRAELEQQLGADEIRRQLHNEDIMRRLQETRKELESSLDIKPTGQQADAAQPEVESGKNKPDRELKNGQDQ